jgi:3-hydroxyisobutyrate dehydrogenase
MSLLSSPLPLEAIGDLGFSEPKLPPQLLFRFVIALDLSGQRREDRLRRVDADADKQKVRVGLLGVGLMGSAMGRRLLDQGIEVIAWNRSPERAVALEERGARRADAPTEVVLGADVVITMLPTAPIVLDVVEPLLEDWPQETIWLQMSSVGAAEADRLVEVARAHDVALVDAPFSGSTHPAEEGKLTILASGPDSARAPVEPVFAALGSRVLWVGKAGMGSRLKLEDLAAVYEVGRPD